MIQFVIRSLELGGVASRAGLQLAHIGLFARVSLTGVWVFATATI